MRLEPVIVELEREQNDLLIIGHASVIRCLLAYLIGLPASEVPAVEIARGDLVEVVPASYGVHSQAFHFWSGPGRSHDEGDETGTNYYENYAEGEFLGFLSSFFVVRLSLILGQRPRVRRRTARKAQLRKLCHGLMSKGNR